jgi:hypothetical protein
VYIERPHPSHTKRGQCGQKFEEILKIYQKEGGECYYTVYMRIKIMGLIFVDDVRYLWFQCCGSGMFIPDPESESFPSQIPDPGSKRFRIPDLDPRKRI